MSRQQLLTIGLIPENHPGGLIMCGDPISSGTQELTFEITEDVITSNEIPELMIDGSKLNWFSSGATLWQKLSKNVNSHIAASIKLKEETLLCLWCLLMDEPLTSSENIIELPDEYGEFYNKDKQFNKQFYFRYQEVEDNEYLSDRLFVLKHD